MMIRELMTGGLITVRPETSVQQARDLLAKERIRHLPVVEGDASSRPVTLFEELRRLVHHRRAAHPPLRVAASRRRSGGIPATGAIARTATNVRTGGRTPVAGMVHAIVLLAILLAAGEWAGWIPMATLAGILLVVAYNMSEWHVFVRLMRAPRSDVLVLIATFGLTVAVNLTVAIQVGVVLASLLFMRRMAEVTQVKAVRDVLDYEISEPDEREPQVIPSDVGVFEINGSFCFGAARKFTEALLASHRPTRVVVLRMRHVLAIDATGLQALEDVAARLRKRGTRMLIAGVHAQPLVALERSGALERIGEENLFETLEEALDSARATA